MLDLSWFGHIIDDIKSYTYGRKDWKVEYTPREGNTEAHLLAKFALELDWGGGKGLDGRRIRCNSSNCVERKRVYSLKHLYQ